MGIEHFLKALHGKPKAKHPARKGKPQGAGQGRGGPGGENRGGQRRRNNRSGGARSGGQG